MTLDPGSAVPALDLPGHGAASTRGAA